MFYCVKEKSKGMSEDKYLQGRDSNMLGNPISFGKVTTVPEGPMTHLMVFDKSF